MFFHSCVTHPVLHCNWHTDWYRLLRLFLKVPVNWMSPPLINISHRYHCLPISRSANRAGSLFVCCVLGLHPSVCRKLQSAFRKLYRAVYSTVLHKKKKCGSCSWLEGFMICSLSVIVLESPMSFVLLDATEICVGDSKALWFVIWYVSESVYGILIERSMFCCSPLCKWNMCLWLDSWSLHCSLTPIGPQKYVTCSLQVWQSCYTREVRDFDSYSTCI